MNIAPKENRLSFTVSFHFHSGRAFFDGFTLETVVSRRINAKYRILAKNPTDGHMYTFKGMEEPMSQKEINDVLDEQHNKTLCFEEFAFEVFDETGKDLLFATKFNAQDKVPPNGNSSDNVVYTTFSWAFELPERLMENEIESSKK